MEEQQEEETPAKQRARRVAGIRSAQREVLSAEKRLKDAIDKRDNRIIEAHGKPYQGLLTHNEIADATAVKGTEGLSKGRIRQIVGPHSARKEQGQ